MILQNNYRLFTWATILWIGICLLFTGSMQASNDLAVYLWYCLPGALLFLTISYFVYWKNNAPFPVFILSNVMLFVITGSIFFSIFFRIFNPSHRFTFEKVENCQIIGQMNANLLGGENYSILYVDLNYQKDSLLGYGCLSDQNQDYALTYLNSFNFYQRDESYLCGPISKGDSYNLSSKRTLFQDRTRQLRIKSRVPKYRTGSVNSCTAMYKFSNVKLPSWMCLSKKDDIVTAPQTCYVSFYKDNALSIAKSRKGLRTTSSFAMITFNDIYFPKSGLICLIVFAYLPMLASLHSIAAVICNSIGACFCPENKSEKAEFENENQGSIKSVNKVFSILDNPNAVSITNSHQISKYVNGLDSSLDANNMSIQMQRDVKKLIRVDYPTSNSNRNQLSNLGIQAYNTNLNNQNIAFI